jgi:hypothetical protein
MRATRAVVGSRIGLILKNSDKYTIRKDYNSEVGNVKYEVCYITVTNNC